MRVRVVPETVTVNLMSGILHRASHIAEVFRAFPDTQAVLYCNLERDPLAVIVDRSDVSDAIETPSGKSCAPRLRRRIADICSACESWLEGVIPEIATTHGHAARADNSDESAIDPIELAREAIDQLLIAGSRARIDAKRVAWQDFDIQEASGLANILVEAQHGPMSKEEYASRLDKIVEQAA